MSSDYSFQRQILRDHPLIIIDVNIKDCIIMKRFSREASAEISSEHFHRKILSFDRSKSEEIARHQNGNET